ncbi:MAG TPA: hypothetical protein ENJ09_11565, partial [Planctomycetes bacterium]|nr:hypothetical protein [Planctomycetota bacterium]
MAKADQDIRKEVIDSGVTHPDRALVAKMRELDAAHAARLKEVLREHGWPGISLVGADGSSAAFLIVQHADPAT